MTLGRRLLPFATVKALPASLVLLSFLPCVAGAGGLVGTGRVSLQPGWRLTPNDTFYASASAVGAPPATLSPGGPALSSSFAYSINDLIELGIDLFAGAELLRLEGQEPLVSLTYGGVVGLRLHWALGDWGPLEDVVPYAGLLGGPVLVYASGGNLAAPSELATTGYMGSLGISARLGDRWGLCAEYRLLAVRGVVPGIGSVNGGGSWLGIGVTWYFPAEVASPL